MDNLYKILSDNIKKHRKQLGLTQKELAQKLGYSEKAISKWESGKGIPPTELLPKLAKELKSSLDGLMYEPISLKLYLGIDGGGTKTEFLLANPQGEILRRCVLGASNPNDVGFTATQEILREGIFEVCGEYSMNTICVFAGLAGAGVGNNAQKITEFLSRFGFASVKCNGDHYNAVSASLGNQNGVTIIMGTGAIAIAQIDGEKHRVGGYGYLFGDAGSGFAIGRDVILAALCQEDGSGQQTALYQAVLKKCGGNTVLDKITDFYKGGKRLIANYAPLAFEAYVAGDAVAKSIVERNVKAIAQLVKGASTRVPQKPVKVMLCGGLTKDKQIILPILQQELRQDSEYSISVCDKSMAQGALMLAGLQKGE